MDVARTQTFDGRTETTTYAWTPEHDSKFVYRSPVEGWHHGADKTVRYLFSPNDTDLVLEHHPLHGDPLSDVQAFAFENLFKVYGNGPKNSVQYLVAKGTDVRVFPLLSLLTDLNNTEASLTKADIVARVRALSANSKVIHEIVWFAARSMYAGGDDTLLKKWDTTTEQWMTPDNKRQKSFDDIFLPNLKRATKLFLDTLASTVSGKNVVVRPVGGHGSALIQIEVLH